MDEPKTSLTADAEKLLERMTRMPPREPGDKLRPEDEARILELAELGPGHGWTQEKIAAAIGCHQSTVSRTIAAYTDTGALAQKYLRAKAHDMVRRFVAEAKSAEILRMLGKLEVVRDDHAHGAQLGVQVVLGLGECPVKVIDRH